VDVVLPRGFPLEDPDILDLFLELVDKSAQRVFDELQDPVVCGGVLKVAVIFGPGFVVMVAEEMGGRVGAPASSSMRNSRSRAVLPLPSRRGDPDQVKMPEDGLEDPGCNFVPLPELERDGSFSQEQSFSRRVRQSPAGTPLYRPTVTPKVLILPWQGFLRVG
jgi:hypothetical protein